MAFWQKKQIERQKLNICFVTKRFPYPGKDDDSYLWPMARELTRRGHSVEVLAFQNPYHRKEIQSGNVHAQFLGETKQAARRNFANLVYEQFSLMHKKKPFHIVHSLDQSGTVIGRHRKDLKVIVAFDVSATQMAQIFSILGMAQETLGSLLSTGFALFYKFVTTYFRTDRKLLASTDAVFVTSPLQQILLERHYLFPEYRTFLVPYGMDYIDLEVSNQGLELKTKLNIPVESQVILTHTDMTEVQELISLFRAFARVVVKKPNSRLVIVGQGPLRSRIEYEVLNLVLGNKVVFAGPIPSDEITSYIAMSDLYVNLSSRSTGFEPIMLTAMAQKKVVIGSEMSPMSTIIEDGINGFLVRPADVDSLTSLLHKVLNAELPTEAIGTQARDRVINLFDEKKMVDLLENAYYEVINRTGRRVSI